MNRWLFHPWLTLRLQILLGIVFLVAAWPKVLDPPGFAKAVAHYELLPPLLVAWTALVLPWLEGLVGIALVLGIWVRAAALWAGVLLLTFMGALGFNLARGHAVDCGCFQLNGPERSDAERLADMKVLLLRDALWLLVALHVGAATRPRNQGHSCPPPKD